VRSAVAVTLTAMVAVALAGNSAYADPSITEIERRINAVWLDAEPLIEKYNRVHDKYLRNKAKQADLLRQVEPLQRQVDLARLRSGAIAAQVYRGGNASAFAAILNTGSPKVLADRLTFLDYMTQMQQRQIAGVTALMREYDEKRAPLDAVVAELAQQDADLAARRKVIQGKIDELEKLRLQAYGTTTGTGAYRPWACPAPDEYLPTKGWKAAVFACQQAGDAYDMGAAGPDTWDCSGLTMVAWQRAGVGLPHNAEDQRNAIRSVKRVDLRPGDLVFYYADLHHVAIYVGDGKVMHAPTWSDKVRMRVLEDVGPVHSYGRPG
jgi:cell wall-associated NlpC family hydrolase